HRDLESHDGRRVALFPGDVFVGVLGDRYATDQYLAFGRVNGPVGHIVGIGGVVGEVVSMHTRMTPLTTVEFLGRLADAGGRPLHLRQFQSLPTQPAQSRGAPAIFSLGASMNAGKTTTGMQIIYSLRAAGFRVAAAKITGTACRKDLNFFYDAGAIEVLDFTDAGWPSTANLPREELLAIARRVRARLQAPHPDSVSI